MKNFNTMGVHWKIQFLGGEGAGWFTKKQYRVISCLKGGGLGQFADLGGRGLVKKRRGQFWGGIDTLSYTGFMMLSKKSIYHFKHWEQSLFPVSLFQTRLSFEPSCLWICHQPFFRRQDSSIGDNIGVASIVSNFLVPSTRAQLKAFPNF